MVREIVTQAEAQFRDIGGDESITVTSNDVEVTVAHIVNQVWIGPEGNPTHQGSEMNEDPDPESDPWGDRDYTNDPVVIRVGGDTACFVNTVRNTSNSVDTINISYVPELSTIDNDWVVQLLMTDGITPLYDTNGDGIVDFEDVALFADAWLNATTIPPLSEPASNPTPPNNATNVSINSSLSWTAGTGAQSHDIYFGTTTPPPFQQNQDGTTFNPGLLLQNTPYYWQIKEVNIWGATTGPVWSFTTVSGPPPP